MMFNASLLLDRTQIVRSSLSRLRALALLSLADFRANPDHYAIAEHHLRRALQALLDIGRHVVVKSGWGNPSNYREVFDLLEKGAVVAEDLAERGRKLAGYRNRLVHEYAAVTDDEMWKLLQTCLDSLAEVLRRLAEHTGGG